MNPTSISALLEGFESELQTADGRTVRVCRDGRGNFWAVDDAERAVPLSEFASDCGPAARRLCERERSKAMRELALWVKRAILDAVQASRTGAQFAHP